MNKELYYTPEISEFYTGFEFEYYHTEGKLIKRENLNTEEWKKSIINLDWFIRLSDEYEHPFNNDNVKHLYRVKYLDKEDIESLGFVDESYLIMSTSKDSIVLSKDRYTIVYYTISKKLHISSVKIFTSEEVTKYEHDTLFEGYIKNKSELQVLMKQLKLW